jgi:hypothetical protein
VKPRRTPSSNRVFRLPGGTEDNDLWVTVTQDADGDVVIGSTWELDDDERKAIADGANIRLLVWGQGHPPVAVFTTTDQLGKGGE